MSAPPASFTSAVTVSVSVGPARTSVLGESVSEAATCWTPTEVVPTAEPDVAVIVAAPAVTAVTRPEEETVATAGAEDTHDTDAPGIAEPFWSLTSAESCSVSSSDEKANVLGETVRVVATGVSAPVPVGDSVPPQPASAASRRARHRAVGKAEELRLADTDFAEGGWVGWRGTISYLSPDLIIGAVAPAVQVGLTEKS